MEDRKNESFKLFWGDSHQNTYRNVEGEPPLAEMLSSAATYLDFYSGAYYTPAGKRYAIMPDLRDTILSKLEKDHADTFPVRANAWKGIQTELTKPPDVLSRQWNEFQETTAAHNSPGRFVTFPGYEWQGNGLWGDHNVIYKAEGPPLYSVLTLLELYKCLKKHDALAIPHHIGYHPGIRAPLWEHCNEQISPYAEIYSRHGCSETDEEWIGLRRNPHMGPGVAGSTYEDALKKGLHIGAICSTDNWSNMPGFWNEGLMACLATELTRDSLWDAFLNRRVYGITGDRIELGFFCNGQPMGSIIEPTPNRNLNISVRGQDEIDRIELLRNGRVIATHCHQGTWENKSDSKSTRFKLRIEVGWGPSIGEIPFLKHKWAVDLALSRGHFIGWSPCWIESGQNPPSLDGGKAHIDMLCNQFFVGEKQQNAVVLEFESDSSAEMTVQINGKTVKDKIHSFMEGSRILWYRDECLDQIRKLTDIVPDELERQDPDYYHFAFKAKLHRVIPEAGYAANFSLTDSDPRPEKTHYRVRVEQRNGQRAWSSPIWLEKK